MSNLVVTLDINYPKEITDITFPFMQEYAKNINADFKVITERKYSNLPITLEKFQLYDLSLENDWIIFLDADVLINPKTVDFTKVDKDVVIVSEHINTLEQNTPQFQVNNVLDKYTINNHSPFYFLAFHNSQREVVTCWDNPLQYRNYINASDDKKEWYLDDFLLALNIIKFGISTASLKDDFLLNTIAHKGIGMKLADKVSFLKTQALKLKRYTDKTQNKIDSLNGEYA